MKKQMKKNLLVTLAEKNYVPQVKQLFSSVYWNAGWKGDYMLLSHGIPEKELNWFRKKGILIRKCKLLHNKRIGPKKYHPVMLSKSYLLTPEFKKWKNIIYLDSDIIVRGPLEKLTKTKGFCAVEEGKLRKNFIALPKSKALKELKENYNLNTSSFNAGFFVFNTDIIKKEDFKELKTLTKKYLKISTFGDQPILNLFFYKKYKKLPNVYNTFIPGNFSLFKRLYSKTNSLVLHFCGDCNPWSKKSPYYDEWLSNLEKSEKINLSKVQTPKLSKEIIEKSERSKKIKLYYGICWRTEQFIGKIGNIIKKLSPNFHKSLKKLLNL
jgi:lipopolysaccharide biosynthesis glycosyltransferase